MGAERLKHRSQPERDLLHLGISFDSDQWILRRTIVGNAMEATTLQFETVPVGWRRPIKRYLADAMLGNSHRSTRYAAVVRERFITLRQFAQYADESGASRPEAVDPELIKSWSRDGHISRSAPIRGVGPSRMRTKFLNVDDFLQSQPRCSPQVREALRRLERRISQEARLRKRPRRRDIDEDVMLKLLNDALVLIEKDGDQVAASAHAVMQAAIAPGAVDQRTEKRTEGYYNGIARLEMPAFTSGALRSVTHKGSRGFREVEKIAQGAAILVIALLTVMRWSEIRRLEIDSIGRAPADVGGQTAGLMFIRGTLSKSQRKHAWVAAPAVEGAIDLLVKLGSTLRGPLGTKALFVHHLAKGWPLRLARRELPEVSVCSFVWFKQRIRDFAQASAPDEDVSTLSFRTCRRFMARFVARRDRTSLGALAYQYGHLESRITDTYYVGPDTELGTLIREERAEEVARAMDDLVSADAVYSKLPPEAMELSRKRMAGLLQRAATSRDVMRMLGAGVVLGPCDWGYCFYRPQRSRCKGDLAGPNAAWRTPSTCATCLNFTATERHRDWWLQRVKDLREFLRLRELPEQARHVALERLAAAEDVLKGIGGAA